MKNVLKVFGVDIMIDKIFQRVLLEYEKLLDGNIGVLILFDIGLLLEIMERFVNIVDCEILIEF